MRRALVPLVMLIGPVQACAVSASTQAGGASPTESASGAGKPAQSVPASGAPGAGPESAPGPGGLVR